MTYLGRNRKHATNYNLAAKLREHELEASAQFWLVYALIAAQAQIKSAYLTSGERKSEKVSQLRHKAQYICNTTFGLKTVFIAQQLNRHRTTVAEAFRKVEDMRDDPKFDKFLSFTELALLAMSESVNGEMQ
jgi:chromosomal replication initiation ATPase DnaA